MIRTPAHKQTDPTKAAGQIKTLGEYIDQKTAHDPKKITFEEWWAIWYGCYTEDIDSPLKHSMRMSWDASRANL